MLELNKIKKSYTTGNFTQHALKGIDLTFRENEFVAILGPSGSGKTTLLNIIGGLDRYDSGDLVINNKSTKKFTDTEWDAYRNNCIGFIFQSYNLINHISVLENVEMGMTLSGISAKKRRKKALQVLKKVGLKDHAHKKPNQLSGGQMQRVAIARALANDPDIILADEPTGALDTNTSKQIMDLIKEIAKDKLVIMVTHNPELATTYANRIVEFKDGELISDSNPISTSEKKETIYNIKKTAMSFFTALNLSFNNIKTKKGRTLLTAFASSIGIIGIALILSLSNGFDIEIDNFQTSTLSSLPIMISEQSMDMDEDDIKEMRSQITTTSSDDYTEEHVVYPLKSVEETITHTNKITKDYIDYIEKIDSKYVSGLSYTRTTSLNLLAKTGDSYAKIDTISMNFGSMPKKLDDNEEGVIEQNYDLLAGSLPEGKNELLLIVDSKNRVAAELLSSLGFDSDRQSISFEELMQIEMKAILNNDYYKSLGDFYTINSDFANMYSSDSSVSLKIVGIARAKENKSIMGTGSGIIYTEELVDYIVSQNSNSDIVKFQQEKDYNVLTGQKFSFEDENGMNKETVLSYLGADSVPVMISIYPKDFSSKDEIINYLDKYNKGKSEEDQIIYTDMAELISSLSGSIMDAITVVLIAFSAISLVVSSIMIGIITYISVLERTKEIGVLRALGARKKDITRVFNAETFIIGMCSGILGIVIARLLIFPANMIIENMTGLDNVAKMNPVHALVLVLISVTLTIVGGFIPSKIAAKKDPVEALRTE